MRFAKPTIGAAIFSWMLVGLPGVALAAPCDLDNGGAAEVAAARGLAQDACGCPSDDSSARGVWKSCVRDALRDAIVDGQVSKSCARRARKAEMGSTCGRDDRIVCCTTSASRRTRAKISAEGRCRPPRGGSACISPSPYKVDACTQIGCVDAPFCGDGVIDAGETCDPPNGSTCDQSCQSTTCAADDPGTLLACHRGNSDLQLAGIDDVFLAAFSGRPSGTFFTSEIQRFDEAGSLIDAQPIPIGTDPSDDPATTPSSLYVSSATEGDDSFHAAVWGWAALEGGRFMTVFRRQEIPKLGPLTAGPVDIASNVPVGICSSAIVGPIGISPGLDNGEVRTSYRTLYGCEGETWFETITGVSGGFSVPPPGYTSEGSAPLARGASHVAGVWWNLFLPQDFPPIAVSKALRVSWLEPGSPTLVDLLPIPPGLAHSTSPALAASGEVFLAVFALAPNLSERELTTLRAVRFSREGGMLDPSTGLLLTSGGGAIDQVVVDGDADGFQVAYTEAQAGGGHRVRTLRVGTDGSFTLPEDVDTADVATIDVVTTATATFLGYTTVHESDYVSLRVIRLDDP